MDFAKHYITLLLMLLPAELIAKTPEYTKIESTLAFPWFMFFVFLALILIPFIMIIVLSWRKTDKSK